MDSNLIKIFLAKARCTNNHFTIMKFLVTKCIIDTKFYKIFELLNERNNYYIEFVLSREMSDRQYFNFFIVLPPEEYVILKLFVPEIEIFDNDEFFPYLTFYYKDKKEFIEIGHLWNDRYCWSGEI
jgi:hypothetical protein